MDDEDEEEMVIFPSASFAATAVATVRFWKMAKEQSWQEWMVQFSRVVDKVGRTIDEDIMETVIALNAIGIPTTSSCEGHLDHGHSYPWVEIASPDVASIEKQANAKLHEAQQSPDRYRALMDESERLTNDCKRLHWAYAPVLFDYLERFYQTHQLVYDRHLVLDNRLWTGRILLQSQGADYQEFSDVKAQKLEEYQAEMRAFTEFLKTEYFRR